MANIALLCAVTLAITVGMFPAVDRNMKIGFCDWEDYFPSHEQGGGVLHPQGLLYQLDWWEARFICFVKSYLLKSLYMYLCVCLMGF